MPIRKFTVSDFNLKTDGLPAEQKRLWKTSSA